MSTAGDDRKPLTVAAIAIRPPISAVDAGNRSDSSRVDARPQHQVRRRLVEPTNESNKPCARPDRVHLESADRQIVFSDIHVSENAIDRFRTVLQAHLPLSGVEADQVTAGDVTSLHVDRRQWQHRVDLLGPVLVPPPRVQEGKPGQSGSRAARSLRRGQLADKEDCRDHSSPPDSAPRGHRGRLTVRRSGPGAVAASST